MQRVIPVERHARLNEVSKLIALLSVVVGVMVIFGWLFDIAVLTTIVPGLPAIKFNSALSFIFAGASLWLLNQPSPAAAAAGRACGAATALLGLLTLSQYPLGSDIGIDELFVADPTGEGPFPGRSSIPGALNFLLLGSALLLMDVKIAGWRPTEWLALAAAFDAFLSFLGYTYNIVQLYGPLSSSPFALQNIIVMELMLLGVLLARPTGFLVNRLTATDASGLLMRRVLPVAILFPPFVGWLGLIGEQAGFYQTNMGLAIVATATIAVFVLVIAATAEEVGGADTARAKAEAAIRESQALLQAIMDNTSAVIYVKDLDGRYLMVNRRFSELFRISSEAVAGKADADLFPKHLADAFRAMDQRVAAAGYPLTEEEVAPHDDGLHTYISIKCPLRGGDGAVRGVFGISSDITQVKRAESALREREDQLRAIVDCALDAVVTMDSEGTITRWNPQAESTFGWSSDEAVGRVLADTIIPEGYREPHLQGLRRYLETGEARVFGKRLELNALHRDGRQFPVEIAIAPIITGDKKAFSAFVRDITERKLADQKLKSQLERLHLLGQITAAIGERHDLRSIWQVVLRSLEERLSAEFAATCEYNASDQVLVLSHLGPYSRTLGGLLGLIEGARIPIDQNGLSRCVNGELVHEPDIQTSGFPFPQRLARQGLRSLVLAPLQSEDGILGILVIARREANVFSSADCEFLKQLSEHVALATNQARLYAALKQAYDDLRQSQQAVVQQERLRALGQMASGIAHDINNALSPVALYLETLLERETGISPQGRDQLDVMLRAIDDVGQTISRMREFYGHRELDPKLAPVDLNACARQVIDLTRARWRDLPQQRGIVIRLQLELKASMPLVTGVEGEIRDALTNLVFNAVDAMPDGGVLTLRTGNQGGATPSHVWLEVGDSGIGMDEETRRRCLEPFFTTKGERGTGLGLAMVYGMARRHGADLEIESVPGSGTSVTLTFAAAAPSSKTGAAIADRDRAIKPMRILVVDDDPMLIKSLRETLASDGHDVTVSDGGQAGIDAFRAALIRGEPFEAVITDLGMPYVDGHKVAAAIRAASPLTPIILLTGWGQRLLGDDGPPANIDRVLAKPPKLRDLRAALLELSSHEEWE